MFSQSFKPHRQSAFFLLFGFLAALLFTIGCGGKTVEVTTSQNHPAHHDAPQTALETPPDVLAEEPAHDDHESHDHHSEAKATLSEAATDALAEMLDAYFSIGDMLASDKMDDVNVNAHKMLEAFHTLEHDAPAAVWEAHAAHAEGLHDAGHELGELSDIKAARIAYGSLSIALNHFVAAIGVPAGYKKPVYSYVCGMAKEIPQNGIWLQIGDTVRNPYFGSSMLTCHSDKVQLPVASAKMDEHEHHEGPKKAHEHDDHDAHEPKKAPSKDKEKHEHEHQSGGDK
jgi:hypothetical protein